MTTMRYKQSLEREETVVVSCGLGYSIFITLRIITITKKEINRSHFTFELTITTYYKARVQIHPSTFYTQ